MIPVVMEVQSIPRSGGEWVRRVTFSGFPDCVAEADSMEDGMSAAYRQLVDRLEHGGPEAREGGGPRALREDLAPVIELYRSLDA